ncbi:MAG: hypothetical protein ACRCV9_06835, partial [Burkholderiaceae bacterium]
GNIAKYRGRQARVYMQVFDAEFVPRGTKVLRWQGYMEPVRVVRNAQAGTIELPMTRAGMARARNADGLRVTHAQWSLRHPGERGLEYLQGLINEPFAWLSKRFQEE